MQVIRYFDDLEWTDLGEGLSFDFVDRSDGERLAQIALHDPDLRLWKFAVNVPDRYRVQGQEPAGMVVTPLAAKRVCELILRSTVLST